MFTSVDLCNPVKRVALLRPRLCLCIQCWSSEWACSRRRPESGGRGAGGRVMSPARRLEVALDVAHGLAYLHNATPAVLHRDLKGCGCVRLF